MEAKLYLLLSLSLVEKDHIVCSWEGTGYMLNYYISSTMHHCVVQWLDNDDMEVVQADNLVTVAAVDPTYWDFENFEFNEPFQLNAP